MTKLAQAPGRSVSLSVYWALLQTETEVSCDVRQTIADGLDLELVAHVRYAGWNGVVGALKSELVRLPDPK